LFELQELVALNWSILNESELEHLSTNITKLLAVARESLAQQPQLVVERGHLSWISSVSFARNDTTLVTGGGGDDTAILWDLASGKAIRRFRGHTAQILCVAINPIKPELLTASVDKTVRLWDLATGRQLRIYRGHSRYDRRSCLC